MREKMKKGFEHWQAVTVYLMIYDAIAINLSYFLALWLRFDCRYTAIPRDFFYSFLKFAPIYTVFSLIIFWLLRMYKSIWRFASYTELLRVTASTAITAAFHGIFITVIVLKTKGDTERCYLYTANAATAILTALLKGEPGEAYNAANEDTYCSIAQMAELVAKQNGIKVRIETENIQNTGYASTLFMKLNTDKLRKLSWLPKYQLPEMYEKMIVQITKL